MVFPAVLRTMPRAFSPFRLSHICNTLAQRFVSAKNASGYNSLPSSFGAGRESTGDPSGI